MKRTGILPFAGLVIAALFLTACSTSVPPKESSDLPGPVSLRKPTPSEAIQCAVVMELAKLSTTEHPIVCFVESPDLVTSLLHIDGQSHHVNVMSSEKFGSRHRGLSKTELAILITIENIDGAKAFARTESGDLFGYTRKSLELHLRRGQWIVVREEVTAIG